MPLFEMTREDLVECKPVTFTHKNVFSFGDKLFEAASVDGLARLLGPTP